MIFGTAEYMSPEQVRGEELDGRSDVYAAGAILYELLTGAPPFRGHNDVLTMTAHITETPEVPSRRLGRRGVISPALDAVILRALAKNRDERFASAHALRDALFLALRAERPSTLSPASVDPSSQTMAAPLPVPGANASQQPTSSAPPNRLPSSNAPPGHLPVPSAPPARLPLPSSPPVARLPMPSAPPARPPMGSASLMQQPSFSASAGPQAHYTPHAAHPTSSAPPPPNYQAHNHQAHANASAGRPMPPTPTSGHSSDTMLAAPPVVVAPPPSQGTVDPFTTTMTLQGPPSALNGPFSVNPALHAAPSKPGPISPDSFATGKGFRPMVWVTVAVFAVLLGVALGVGLSLYH
jgi:serine/threonine protein kinase